MFRHCCVPKCETQRQDAKFHRFPVTKENRDQWLRNIGSEELLRMDNLANKAFVCHKHFEKRFVTASNRLKIVAVPTLFTESEINTGNPATSSTLENTIPTTNHTNCLNQHQHDHTYCACLEGVTTEILGMDNIQPTKSDITVKVENSTAVTSDIATPVATESATIMPTENPVTSSLNVLVTLKQSSNLASLTQDTINNTRSPLSEIQVTDDEDREPAIHEDVICDNCSGQIIGFRYKCVTCDNYDLCQKCEMLEYHSDHYMLRIPKSLKFEIPGNFIVKLREILKSDQTRQELDKRTDKASKSVKENVQNDDKAIDLTENVKKTIQREVNRALKSVKKRKKNKENRIRHVTETKDDTSSDKQRTNEENVTLQVNKIEDDENIEGERAIEYAPELVFADVNETELSLNLVKAEVCSTGPHHHIIDDQDNLRTFYLKTDIDLSQFMIQVVPSSENPS